MTPAIPQHRDRDAMLAAAERVVIRQGIANLTLDAVAAEAGMSKGGLLHHFPSKDRLVEALVTRSAEGWRACYTEAYERTPPGPGRIGRLLRPTLRRQRPAGRYCLRARGGCKQDSSGRGEHGRDGLREGCGS